MLSNSPAGIGAPAIAGCLPQGCVDGKVVCNCQCSALVRFKRNLLREHHVAWNKIPSRHEAPPHQRSAIFIKFVDIDRCTVENAITQRFPVSQPMTSKHFSASNWAR
jgi:hypothetical protein